MNIIYKVVIKKHSDPKSREIQSRFIEIQKQTEEMKREIYEAQHVEDKVLHSAITI